MLDQWYGIMPNRILFNKDLSDKEKLLFCFISSLCAEKWYCRATNEYMAEKMWVTDRTIREHISNLAKLWYITVNIENNTNRTIRISRVEENLLPPGRNLPTPQEENFHHNNINNNNTKENSLANFEIFRNKRPKKEWKKDALKKFINLSQEKQKKAIEWLDKWLKSERRSRWIIMAATTYINQERREDEIDTKPKKLNTMMYH